MIPLSVPLIGRREEKIVKECIRSGFVSSVGSWVKKFEEAFAAKIGARYAVSTSSGTAALHLALVTLGIREGDYVAVPDLTFVATVNPVLYCGAIPLLIDVEPQTWCMDVDIFRELCKKFCGKKQKHKLKAVIPVHLYGVSCNIKAIINIAKEYGVYVIEDATEALGTKVDGRYVGTFGDIGCFSFNGNKLITTGAGGMIVTASGKIAQEVAYLSTQARDDTIFYQHNNMGFNYRMDSLSAAFGLAQLERMDKLLEKRRKIAGYYKRAFSSTADIQLHPEPPQTEGSFWLYSIVYRKNNMKNNVMDWIKRASLKGISLRPFFLPLHKQKYIKIPVWAKVSNKIKATHKQSVSELLYNGGLNLPSSPTLTLSQQEEVINFILEQTK